MDTSDELSSRIRHLMEVERLSMRQIARELGISRRRVSTLSAKKGAVIRPLVSSELTKPYERIIHQWYEQYPSLKAQQVFERLGSYGYKGSYTTVKRFTRRFRNKPKVQFHELNFMPGEEAQVDWMQ